MHSSLKYLVILIWGLNSVHLLGEDARILEIRKVYEQAIAAKPNLNQLDTTYYDLSAEGAEVSYYSDNSGAVIIIEAKIFGESGNIEEKLYFFKNKLVFLYRIEERYLVPISVRFMNPEELAEMGVSVSDLEKKETLENRFYFNNGTMIRWIDENGEMQKPGSKKWNIFDKYCNDSARDYFDKKMGS
jgi:hypothetical protein